MFDEVTASNLVKIDHKGNIVEDITGFGVNQAGFVIHGCVHEARPEAQCVLHTHTRAGIAVAASTEGLPLSQHSARLVGEVTYHDYEGIALDMDERERLAKNLGPDSRCMILRNHGLLTLGHCMRERSSQAGASNNRCRTQLDALAAVGRAGVTLIPDAAVERTRQQVYRPREHEYRDWPALLRMLDRRGVDFRS